MNPDSLQKKGRKLTVEELRKYKGFEKISRKEAEIITDELFQLSLLCNFIYQAKRLKMNEHGTGNV